ncbi:alpha/beta hydrolase [Lentibacillus saliphilus]|uniref:alpha/beta hydrolase n=1 Tax=Lentibacillus saliphilus TaxID=2737028 RepID=UPI001C2FFB3A|nr:alpha/beta hydrolase [Lentibacillus saliphilus]
MKHDFWLTMDDGTEIFVNKWLPNSSNKPSAVVQLAHGMVEHIGRYDAFANFLATHNIVVYGNDHRGHGQTGVRQGKLGYFADEDGFSKTSNDLYTITRLIKEQYPDIPLFLFGHSMGSFLVRHFIQKHSYLVDGVVLCGTGYHTESASHFAQKLALLLPPKKESTFLNQLVFGSYNRKIPDHQDDFDWLSRDPEAVQAYNDDPLTGFVPTAQFFYDLMTGLAFIHNDTRNEAIRPDLPMLIMSGDSDPVGHYGRGVWKTAEMYVNAGLTEIITMLFQDGRHELLHESNHQEVYQAVYNWIVQQLHTLNSKQLED